MGLFDFFTPAPTWEEQKEAKRLRILASRAQIAEEFGLPGIGQWHKKPRKKVRSVSASSLSRRDAQSLCFDKRFARAKMR